MSIEGDGRVQAGLAALEDVLTGLGTVGLAVEERSHLITIVHRVGESVLDNMEDDDVKDVFRILNKSVIEITGDEGDEIKVALASALRRVWLATIDAMDLEDTGRYRRDVAAAPPIFREP